MHYINSLNLRSLNLYALGEMSPERLNILEGILTPNYIYKSPSKEEYGKCYNESNFYNGLHQDKYNII